MTLANRDISKEGIWRLRREDEDKKQSKYVCEYLGETLHLVAFIEKYCPEEDHCMLRYRIREKNYTPAECIVRYNALHTPIHMPDVEYTIGDLRAAIFVFSKKVLRDKAKRDKKECKGFIKRKLIL